MYSTPITKPSMKYGKWTSCISHISTYFSNLLSNTIFSISIPTELKFIVSHVTYKTLFYQQSLAEPVLDLAWWRHHMETFSALLAICAGNSAVPGDFPAQRPVTRSFDVFFDLHLNKWLSKQSWGWWFETLTRPLWRHCNDTWKSLVSTWSCWMQVLIYHKVKYS